MEEELEQIPQKPKKFSEFKTEWIKSFNWLKCEFVYNPQSKTWEEVMFCTYCLKYYDHLLSEMQKGRMNTVIQFQNSFIKGTKSIRKQRCSEHETDQKEFHNKAFKYINNPQDNSLLQQEKQAFNKLFTFSKISLSQQLLLPLFSCSYFVAKQDLAILKYESLKQFLDFNKVELNRNYSTRMSCYEFIEEIYSSILQNLIEELKNSRYISISVDSSFSKIKNEELIAIAVKYIDNSFEIQEKYLCISELDGLKAISYFHKLINTLKQYQLLQNVYYLCTDGAKVMKSEKNGLVGLLTKEIPYLLSSHCIAHKTCLGLKDLTTEYQTLSKLNYQIYDLCSYLSSYNKQHLLEVNQRKAFQSDEDDILNLIKPFDIRWVSYFPAIERLVHNYLPILQTLSELIATDDKTSFRAKSLLKYYRKVNILIIIGYYGDALEQVYRLSKQFQQKSISLESFNIDLKICLKNLESLSQVDPNNLFNAIKESEQQPNTIKVGKLSYLIWTRINNQQCDDNKIILDNIFLLKGKKSLSQFYDQVMLEGKQMVQSLINLLQDRFEDIDFQQNFDCLNPDTLRNLSEAQVNDYGNSRLISIYDFYKQNNSLVTFSMDIKILLMEYEHLKYLMIGQFKEKSIQEILQLTNQSFNLKNINEFLRLYMTFPLTTVEVERIFSHCNIIITKKRNQLSIDNINKLLMISRNGPQIETFNFLQVINNWQNNKNRYFI